MDSSNRDYLTGLYTRQELYRLYQSMESGSCFHFMFLDIDNFKNVNDVYGHNTGDLLLKAVARILKDSAPTSFAIRLGGDEFVMLFTGSHSREQLCEIAENIISRITAKEGFAHISTYISASVGILYHETVSGSLDDILLKSDMAMYYAKSHGKGQYIVFNDIAKSVFSEIEMEQKQTLALENGEFEIRYLPIISAQTSRLRLSQVRLYWKMSEHTIKSQEEFLPLFEKNGFIIKLDEYIWEEACRILRKWIDLGYNPVPVSVNVSRRQIFNPNFLDMLVWLTEKYNLPHNLIGLELPESVFIDSQDAIYDILDKLKKEGFILEMDDFGEGHSSLKMLQNINVDVIKIDKCVLDETLNKKGRVLLKHTITMAKELNLKVIADGVEDKEELSFLNSCGCDFAQGFYFSKPLSIDEFEYKTFYNAKG